MEDDELLEPSFSSSSVEICVRSRTSHSEEIILLCAMHSLLSSIPLTNLIGRSCLCANLIPLCTECVILFHSCTGYFCLSLQSSLPNLVYNLDLRRARIAKVVGRRYEGIHGVVKKLVVRLYGECEEVGEGEEKEGELEARKGMMNNKNAIRGWCCMKTCMIPSL